MQILLQKKASFWHRRMHCLLMYSASECAPSSKTGSARSPELPPKRLLTTSSALSQCPVHGMLTAKPLSPEEQGGTSTGRGGASKVENSTGYACQKWLHDSTEHKDRLSYLRSDVSMSDCSPNSIGRASLAKANASRHIVAAVGEASHFSCSLVGCECQTVPNNTSPRFVGAWKRKLDSTYSHAEKAWEGGATGFTPGKKDTEAPKLQCSCQNSRFALCKDGSEVYWVNSFRKAGNTNTNLAQNAARKYNTAGLFSTSLDKKLSPTQPVGSCGYATSAAQPVIERSPTVVSKTSRVMATLQNAYMLPMSFMNGAAHDLKRFLEEVGTDPKEARYWLKQFQRSTDADHPFAVVQVDQEVFTKPEMLEGLGSCLAFLHRHDMKPVIVHGCAVPEEVEMTPQVLYNVKNQLVEDSMRMVNVLEAQGAPARPLFSGGCILEAEPKNPLSADLRGTVKEVNPEPLKWCLRSGHIPVISTLGETSTGQVMTIDSSEATEQISQILAPLKVMFLNTQGGIVDRGDQQTVVQVNLPADLENLLQQPWCTLAIKQKVLRISELLNKLPPESSVVITSANAVLTELFTHHGSGTFFKNTEPIKKYKNLADVDLKRLNELIKRSFGRVLKDDYWERLQDRLNTLYLSEGYNAAAIVTNEQVDGMPYLDKFSVSTQIQNDEKARAREEYYYREQLEGQGTSEMLWEHVRRDFKSLFWRSRGSNKINPWYFKRSEGSWSDGQWTVFWYGVSQPKLSYELVDFAAKLPSSFTEDDDIGSKASIAE
ncbi:PREDICTED: N-acetylglutamate synthase, mitochondrial-like isoform X1 [Branchiostoma belcheri]|uniref:acetylglutamate kinase n=1 Tax=Branchiostoma belcheri TaxID=7741 RepID=A0A6P4ZQW1_BRABE|nr:PREDICTED: N-acetylglutamate synthase, mitochondrial-like isoform X1 [Branchiostoma belcheri]XP_019636460.1 PREDICTED: N-acetylglutamate synthase, mitochondrial-like isoform X1 [Branchiostoma belcheri]